MVKSCCAYGCNEKFIKGGPITFHRFPKNEERRDIWEKNIRRENFKVTNNSLVCSKHFSADCFDQGKFGGTWLKSDAVPTIFAFPQYLQIKTSKRRVLNRNIEENPKPSKRLKYVGDFDEEVLQSPTKAKLAVIVASEKLNKQSKVIKTLRQKERRLQKKLKTFQEITDYLKQKAYISNNTKEVLEDCEEDSSESTHVPMSRKRVQENIDYAEDSNESGDEPSASSNDARWLPDSPEARIPSQRFKRPCQRSKADEVLEKIARNMDKSLERQSVVKQKHDSFGQYVAEKLRSLQPNMAIYCQKIINDAMFLAETGNLTVSSKIFTSMSNSTNTNSVKSEFVSDVD